MSRDYTYFLREFRTREELSAFIRSELNDPGCGDDAVSMVFEPGRGWVLLVRSPRHAARERPRDRIRERERERERPPEPAPRRRGRRNTAAAGEGLYKERPMGYSSYGAGKRKGNPDRNIVDRVRGGGDREVDKVGRHGTKSYKLK